MEPESTQANLAEAAWRWRSAMSGGPEQRGRQQQPFQNMTALFHTKKDRAKAFTRLIEAGGGHVISARPPYSEVEGVTHFFVEMETNHEKIDLGSFASRGIPCLKPFFINSCIMEDSPEISDFFIPEYKDILVNMR
ncbi:DNA topoisomerase 2-binding protein 1-B [Chionoecetes opilio]|uniref:DNA topoisomerase 2-binding protein 1-B n=1 Tax=Chionoecetes opilio TaxID=41210 RepID=A0A8J4YN54_CHIOP|nr:DNA topoisomerase 2-binding protein 1-B [Chionoecetes opilio]